MKEKNNNKEKKRVPLNLSSLAELTINLSIQNFIPLLVPSDLILGNWTLSDHNQKTKIAAVNAVTVL